MWYPNEPWVQSLLLLTPMRTASPEEPTLGGESSRAIQYETPWGVSAESSGYAQPEHTLGENGLFWPAQVQTFRKPLSVVGNELVAVLPVTIQVVVHCVICARDRVQFAWSFDGPIPATPHPVPTILASPSKPLRVKPLAAPYVATTDLGIVIVREGITPRVAEAGLYLVTVYLNDQAAGKAPVFVRPPFTAAQPSTPGHTDRSPE